MRPIKFRGKSKESGKWVTGYYAKVDDKYYLIPEDAGIRLPSGFKGNTTESDDKVISAYGIFGFVEVIPETVAQFTGLKDVNGTGYAKS